MTKPISPFTNVRRKAKQIAFLLLLSLLASCSHLIHLDRAQNSFNRGAELENRSRFSPQNDIAISPSTYYTLAYAELGKALKNKPGLRSDNVLANAYTMKALCEWKLKLYSRATASANEALGQILEMEDEGIRLPRDKALMEALPSIMMIDQAREELALYHEDTLSYDSAKAQYFRLIYNPGAEEKAQLEAALIKIGTIRQQPELGDETATYFIMSQLAGLKAWSDCLDFLRRAMLANKETMSEDAREAATLFRLEQRNGHLDKWKKNLLEELEKKLPEGGENSLYRYWNLAI